MQLEHLCGQTETRSAEVAPMTAASADRLSDQFRFCLLKRKTYAASRQKKFLRRKTNETNTMVWTVPWNLLGIWVSGDIGDYTVFTDKFGRKIPFPRAPPDKPPSALQQRQRLRFKFAQSQWKALSSVQKENLETACRTLALTLTGQNLYISAILRDDPVSYETVSRQSGVPLPNLP